MTDLKPLRGVTEEFLKEDVFNIKEALVGKILGGWNFLNKKNLNSIKKDI